MELEGVMAVADISADVVARVAAKATLEVEGVAAVKNVLGDGKTRGVKTRGVRVIQEKDGCVVHLSVIIAYGERIPEVAWNIQTHVKNTLEEYLGIDVVGVNVLIAGVRE